MKICLVSQEYPPETGGGGIGTQTYLKAQGLGARGHDIHVVSSSWDDRARTYRDGNATVHRIAVPSQRFDWHEPSTYWLAYSMLVAEKLHELDSRIAFDVMQFPEYGADGFIYQSENYRHRRARYSVQCHGPLIMFAEQVGWPEMGSTFQTIGCFMEREVIRYSDLVLASSRCIAELCADRYDYPLDDIHVIHSGVDTRAFAPAESAADEHFPKLLFVGNFTGSKGFDLLIDVVLRLRTDYPRIRLRMIGKGDEQRTRAERRITAQGAQSNFDIKGYVAHADLPREYAWCDIFAAPSRYEPGAANVYLEAMASGKPVIACNSGGAPEAVQHEHTGILITPGSSEQLENAIRVLARDGGLRARLGRAGRAWVEANVAMDKYVDKVETQYQAALQRRWPDRVVGTTAP